MKPRGLLFEIPATPYRVNLCCAFGVSDARLRRDLKPECARNVGAWRLGPGNDAHIDWLSEGTLIFRMRHAPSTPAHAGTIGHEVFHAVIMIMERAGVKLCRQSEEAFAYCTGHITEEIYKRI